MGSAFFCTLLLIISCILILPAKFGFSTNRKLTFCSHFSLIRFLPDVTLSKPKGRNDMEDEMGIKGLRIRGLLDEKS